MIILTVDTLQGNLSFDEDGIRDGIRLFVYQNRISGIISFSLYYYIVYITA